MTYSDYTKRYSTASFYIGIIRAAVEEHVSKHGGIGNLVVVATHISADDYTAQGHAESALDGVIVEVERIAKRRVGEAIDRRVRQEILRNQLHAGIISEEVFDREYGLSF